MAVMAVAGVKKKMTRKKGQAKEGGTVELVGFLAADELGKDPHEPGIKLVVPQP